MLTVVGFNSGVSNAEIARLSGLAPQTVSAILAGLESDGLIKRGDVLRGRRGQPATPIMLNKTGAFSVGVEVGWRHLDVVLIDLHAEVLAQRHIEFKYPDAQTIVGAIAGLVEDVAATIPAESRPRLQDIGIAVPGYLAENLDLLSAPPEQATLWRSLDLGSELRAATGLEPTIINDGNAACWAELIALPRPRPANVVYYLVSHYLAAGIVGNGALWEGPTGHASNLGSMLVQIDGDGPVAAHSIASIWALAGELEAKGKPHRAENWREWDWTALAADVDAWLERSARALALTVFNTITVVDEPLVVIDTVIDPAVTERLAGRLRMELARLPVRNFEPPEIVTGTHGRLAPSIGAAELALYRRYF